MRNATQLKRHLFLLRWEKFLDTFDSFENDSFIKLSFQFTIICSRTTVAKIVNQANC